MKQQILNKHASYFNILQLWLKTIDNLKPSPNTRFSKRMNRFRNAFWESKLEDNGATQEGFSKEHVMDSYALCQLVLMCKKLVFCFNNTFA